jgi:hypothetical protein
MPDRSAAYFHAKARAAAAGDVVSEGVAKISAADLVLRRWKSDRIPHEPRRKRSAEDPLKGLREWPSWQVASEALRRYLGCVREMDEALLPCRQWTSKRSLGRRCAAGRSNGKGDSATPLGGP